MKGMGEIKQADGDRPKKKKTFAIFLFNIPWICQFIVMWDNQWIQGPYMCVIIWKESQFAIIYQPLRRMVNCQDDMITGSLKIIYLTVYNSGQEQKSDGVEKVDSFSSFYFRCSSTSRIKIRQSVENDEATIFPYKYSVDDKVIDTDQKLRNELENLSDYFENLFDDLENLKLKVKSKKILHLPSNILPGSHLVNLHVQPVIKSSIHILMCYEILRIRSYNHCTLPNYSATQLAQAGFYLSRQDGQVTCFNCEISHQKILSGVTLEDAHRNDCASQRKAKNVPLFKGTGGLTLSDLTLFNSIYGDGSSSSHVLSSLATSANNQRTGIFSCKVESDTQPLDPYAVYAVYTSAAKAEKKPFEIDPRSKTWRSSDERYGPEGEASNSRVGNDFLDLRGAAYPLFANRRTRRETFHSWDPSHTQKPDDLVNLGFFYAGYSDCARCFYCGLGLKYWRPNDDAAYQHARFRPQCLYNQFVKGQEFVDQVQRNIATESQNASANAERSEVPNLVELMKSDAARQLMAEGWDRDDVRTGVAKLVQDLGEECLIYEILLEVLVNNQKQPTETETMTRDETDSLNPTLSGTDNAIKIGNNMQLEIDVDNPDKNNTTSAISTTSESIDPDVLLRLLEREHNYLKKRLYCLVCGNNKVGCIYLPCGHVVACQTCGDLASNCILCEKVISAIANIYLS